MPNNKSEIKQIKMKSLKNNNLNPQKQSQPNILGYFNGPKLYKRQNNHSPLHSSRQKNKRSPKQIKKNQQGNQLQNITPPLTAKNKDISLKNRNPQESYISGFYTTRKKETNSQDNISDISNKGLTPIKKQINSTERKRFYYKEEYDLHDKDDHQHQQVQQKSQYRTILPQYFSKINSRGSRIQYDEFQEKSKNREKRSLSPLEESQQKLFKKCYKETSSHLQLMLKQIRESKQKLDFFHEEILENVHEAVKIRSFSLRSQIIDMVQNILDQWQSNEWQFIKNNEILFIDDLLQLKEQLNEREIKVNYLMQKLEKQRNSSWLQKMNQRQIIQNIQNSQTIWKSVTTDLLMFNYEYSIMEIQELSDKISISIPQRCEKAINTLFPGQFNQKIQFRTQNTSNFVNLKSVITKIISQIDCYYRNHSVKHYIQSSKTPIHNLQLKYLAKQTKLRNYQY